MSTQVVITSIARTPIGPFRGGLSPVPAPPLGAAAIAAAVDRSHLKADEIDEVLMGCVLQAGLGQAPARQAALHAGLPKSVPCTAINKVCGSSMKAAMIGHDTIIAGAAETVIAGGMESMSNAPYLLPEGRAGIRLGHGSVVDHMFFDGLEDAYERGRLMGTYADATARQYGFSREEQDRYAVESVTRARKAVESGEFSDEITDVRIDTKAGPTIINRDESPFAAKPEKAPTLKPAFSPDGTVTAASSSSIADGAAAMVLMDQAAAARRNIAPLAKIIGYANHAQEPAWFTTAPIGSIRKLTDKIGWDLDSVDLFEINEAFAVVTMAALRDLNIGHDRVNVNGGACALGHPIGATGARIMVTLTAALHRRKLKRGIASLCIGGGEAMAVAIEAI